MKYLLFIPILLIGCIVINASADFNYQTIEGNGNIKISERNISGIIGIKSSGSFNVEIKEGNSDKIGIEADENLHEYIRTEKNNDGILEVSNKKGYNLRTKHKITIFLTIPEIQTLSISGSGNIDARGNFRASSKNNFHISGSGNINVEGAILFKDLNFHVSGSGDITCKNSKADKLSVHISGSGDIKVEEMEIKNLDAHISGSGDIRANVSSNLKARISGSGSIYYKGTPLVDASVSGSGKIKPITNTP